MIKVRWKYLSCWAETKRKVKKRKTSAVRSARCLPEKTRSKKKGALEMIKSAMEILELLGRNEAKSQNWNTSAIRSARCLPEKTRSNKKGALEMIKVLWKNLSCWAEAKRKVKTGKQAQ